MGHSRRSGRSPLLILALVACVLVLGFNYWVCSSHNLELQTQLYEMETQVRRAAAERGVSEMKTTEFKEEINRRKEQMEKMEMEYQRRMDGERAHKVLLQQNISSSTKTLQELKAQLHQVTDDVGVLQRELQSCQSAIKTLNNKLTYDMTQCHSQVLSQKELCDERLTGVKLEAQKKLDKLLWGQVKTLNESVKATAATAHTEAPQYNSTNPLVPLSSKPPAAETHLPPEGAAEIHLPPEGAAETHLPPEGAAETHLPPEGAAETQLPPEGTNVTVDQELQLLEAKPTDDLELVAESKEATHKPDMYHTEEDHKRHLEEEDLADYNGDDDNEGEFEADKQEALIQT